MKFNYVGTEPDRSIVKGALEAESEKEARAQLKAQQIEVILLKSKGGSAMQMEISFGHVSSTDLLFFVKHLSIMLRSGIPIYEALSMLKSQSKGRLKKILKTVLDRVSSGETLASALSKHPKDFPELFVQLIASGELSGTLEKNLNYISEFIQKDIGLRKKVKSAMMYPAVIFVAVLVLVMGIGLFVLPQILPLFDSLEVKLPLATRFLLWSAQFFKSYGLLTLGVLIAAFFLLPLFLEWKYVRPYSHALLLRLPLAGLILKHLSLARLFRVMATLMEAGLTIDHALNISEKIIHNAVYKRGIRKMQKSVVQGNELSVQMSANLFLFPALVGHMMKVGEKSGNLVESLNYLGAYFEAEVDDRLKNLSTLLEPILLLTIGLIVGFVALSIIGPIYSLSGGI